MASPSGSGSDASQPQQHREPDPKSDSAERNLLLEEVLRETEEALQGQHLKALRVVAERYRGRSLKLDPVALELVRALLQLQVKDPRILTAMEPQIAQIARTIMDDEQSRNRLESLWIQISEN